MKWNLKTPSLLPIAVVVLLCWCSVELRADEMSGDNLQEELSNLRQRKIDFKKDREALSEYDGLSSEKRSDLKGLLKHREIEEIKEEKHRQAYVRSQPKEDDTDAVKRESIEQKLQDRADEAQVAREKKYALIMTRRDQIISQAHLELDENREYDLHVPKKEDHAKARTPHHKK